MATMIGNEATLAALLKDLIQLDYDAIEAYKAAIARVDGVSDKSQLASFLDDHRDHVKSLSELMREMGAEPPTEGDLMQVLTKGKVIVGGLLGDRVVLEAMKTNEADTNTAYERAASRNDIPVHMRSVLEKNFADERRHKAWIEERLAEAEGVLHL